MTGNELKQKRSDKGLSQKELADLVGKTRRTIINYESLGDEPLPKTMARVFADVLGVMDLDSFMNPLANVDKEFKKKLFICLAEDPDITALLEKKLENTFNIMWAKRAEDFVSKAKFDTFIGNAKPTDKD